MAHPFRFAHRLFLALLLALGAGGAALRAQLDPRLQPANSTDFLDPYTSKLSRYWRATSNNDRYMCAVRSEFLNLMCVVSTANGEL